MATCSARARGQGQYSDRAITIGLPLIESPHACMELKTDLRNQLFSCYEIQIVIEDYKSGTLGGLATPRANLGDYFGS